DEEPWKTIKTDEERTKTVMYVALQIAAGLAVLSEPFIPFTSKKLKKMLKLNPSLGWNDISSIVAPSPASGQMPIGSGGLLLTQHQIGEAELLFSKIEDEQIQKQLDKLEATKASNKTEKSTSEKPKLMPQKETINFDDFTKLDMRVGTIIEAEKMPKADKLLVLKVDTGLDVRTVVSGIAESFTPEEVIGKQVTILINLAPRALRGVESQGMILMTENAEGKLVFLNPDTSATLVDRDVNVENGMTIN
ncbi:MAG: methionine--tRNA ligase subunit beta, partial [Flavobacteriales bacterium]|nr:methionine--tRNA ligase subunit beta [Flavobacteriales bacterium]